MNNQQAVFEVGEVRGLYRPNAMRQATARQRQADVWERRQPDRWPIMMNGTLEADQERIPSPGLAEAYFDFDLMLCQQMRPACAAANSDSDAVPSIRANTGTGTLVACLGQEQDIISGQMPWLQRHYSIADAAKLTPDDIQVRGKFAWALEFIAYVRKIMNDKIDIYCVDTQGPFDLAHLLLGNEVFYLIMDDAKLMHQVMNLCTELYIRCTKAVKEATGEPRHAFVHGNGLYAPNVGVRICEDTTTLINRDAIEEFVLPYTLRAAAEFGGAWVHYCGRCDQLRDLLCQCENIRGLNYGIIPGKDNFDFDREMEVMARYGKVYSGVIPRKPNESGRDYLRRLHAYAKGGCLIPNGNAAVGGENGFCNTEAALDFWYSLA